MAEMDESIRHDIMDKAERLALQTFSETAECEHIEAVFERLALHWRGCPPTELQQYIEAVSGSAVVILYP